MPATFVPVVRSKALYTLENAPLHIKTVSQPTWMSDVMMGALSLLLNEVETFQTFINGHCFHSLAFFSNDLFDFARVLLRLLGSGGLCLNRLLLFWLGLDLGFCLMAALRL